MTTLSNGERVARGFRNEKGDVASKDLFHSKVEPGSPLRCAIQPVLSQYCRTLLGLKTGEAKIPAIPHLARSRSLGSDSRVETATLEPIEDLFGGFLSPRQCRVDANFRIFRRFVR